MRSTVLQTCKYWTGGFHNIDMQDMLWIHPFFDQLETARYPNDPQSFAAFYSWAHFLFGWPPPPTLFGRICQLAIYMTPYFFLAHLFVKTGLFYLLLVCSLIFSWKLLLNFSLTPLFKNTLLTKVSKKVKNSFVFRNKSYIHVPV